MSTKPQIRSEDYLRMTFEHDAEFVHSEIVERGMPTYVHGRLEGLIFAEFDRLRHSHGFYPCVEVRMKIAADLYRIPDVAVLTAPASEEVPDKPPLVVVEILSKDDRHSDVIQKLDEYREWGVAHIWVIDPSTKRFWLYNERGLQNVSSLALSEYPFQLTPAELFADL
jgi:Uma2 family endonuclease